MILFWTSMKWCLYTQYIVLLQMNKKRKNKTPPRQEKLKVMAWTAKSPMKKYKWPINRFTIFSTTLVAKEMKITITMEYCFCLKLAVAKRDNYVSAEQNAEKWTLSYSIGGYVNWHNISGGQFGSAFQTH